jgi:hypothetical protein
VEREELEQIPWSQLAIDADDGVDRRWYIVGIAVGLIVVAILALRLLSGGSGQPSPIEANPIEASRIEANPTQADPSAAQQVDGVGSLPPTIDGPPADGSPGDVSAGNAPPIDVGSAAAGADRSITEAQLTVDDATPEVEHTVVAEWFITDLFTVDGSSETVASVRTRVAPDMLRDALAHDDPDAPQAFVEWARAFHVEESDVGSAVSVAFRTIRRTDSGYVREPVRAVVVPMAPSGDRWIVTAWPTATDPP